MTIRKETFYGNYPGQFWDDFYGGPGPDGMGPNYNVPESGLVLPVNLQEDTISRYKGSWNTDQYSEVTLGDTGRNNDGWFAAIAHITSGVNGRFFYQVTLNNDIPISTSDAIRLYCYSGINNFVRMGAPYESGLSTNAVPGDTISCEYDSNTDSIIGKFNGQVAFTFPRNGEYGPVTGNPGFNLYASSTGPEDISISQWVGSGYQSQLTTPSSDIQSGIWTSTPATANLYEKIDGEPFTDTDYINRTL